MTASFKPYAEALLQHFNDQVDEACRELKVPHAVAYEGIRADLKALLGVRAADADARNAFWRTRIRIYRADDPSTVVDDSDYGEPEDKPGAEVVRGLQGVAEYLQQLMGWRFNGAAVEGLDDMTLKHRQKALRPTLSRRGGNAVWRVPFKVDGVEWSASVYVERVR